MAMAGTVGKDGTVYALTQGLVPGGAQVTALP
jgi:polyphosphate kinase 2 (PPK2 family)